MGLTFAETSDEWMGKWWQQSLVESHLYEFTAGLAASLLFWGQPRPRRKDQGQTAEFTLPFRPCIVLS